MRRFPHVTGPPGGSEGAMPRLLSPRGEFVPRTRWSGSFFRWEYARGRLEFSYLAPDCRARRHAPKSIDAHGDEVAQGHRSVNESVDRRRVAGRDVLAVREQDRPVPVIDHGEGTEARAAPLVVVRDDCRMVDDPPAVLFRPPAPVLVLTIHEEALVEEADAGYGGAANEQEGAHDGIDLGEHVVVEIGQVVAPETTMVGEQPGKPRQLVEVRRRRLERAARGRVQIGRAH